MEEFKAKEWEEELQSCANSSRLVTMVGLESEGATFRGEGWKAEYDVRRSRVGYWVSQTASGLL